MGHGARPAGETIAYGVTREGSRWLTLHFLDLESGRTAGESLENLHWSMGSIAWAADGRALSYVRFDPPRGSLVTAPVTGAVVMRRVLGTPQVNDERVFQLTDSPSRNYAVAVTDDGQWLVVTSSIGAAPRQQVWARDLHVQDRISSSCSPTRTASSRFSAAAATSVSFRLQSAHRGSASFV